MPDGIGSPWLWLGALMAGAILGLLFFGGLWWTVRHAATSLMPARWFVGSFVLRTALVLAGFYAIGVGQPARMGLCLLGFLVARVVVVRVTRPTPTATISRTPPCT